MTVEPQGILIYGKDSIGALSMKSFPWIKGKPLHEDSLGAGFMKRFEVIVIDFIFIVRLVHG